MCANLDHMEDKTLSFLVYSKFALVFRIKHKLATFGRVGTEWEGPEKTVGKAFIPIENSL